jgi:hypothetical protein
MKMKKTLALLLLPLALQSASADDFKGENDPARFGFGALTGMGILDNRAGFTLQGTASMEIVERGFVTPDIANSVSIETELGPIWVAGSSAFMYSLHLRWDFEKDAKWTLYAVGGAGGAITGAALGDRFELYPRFGMGAMWKVAPNLRVRAELSHELIGVGVLFPL